MRSWLERDKWHVTRRVCRIFTCEAVKDATVVTRKWENANFHLFTSFFPDGAEERRRNLLWRDRSQWDWDRKGELVDADWLDGINWYDQARRHRQMSTLTLLLLFPCRRSRSWSRLYIWNIFSPLWRLRPHWHLFTIFLTAHRQRILWHSVQSHLEEQCGRRQRAVDGVWQIVTCWSEFSFFSCLSYFRANFFLHSATFLLLRINSWILLLS